MRLIDADALVIMLGLKPDEWGTPDERWRPESEFGLWIINAPTIEPKRGRWIIEDKYKDYRTERCSVCGFVANRPYIQDIWNYCPNCGARMEDEDEPKPCVSCPYNPVEAMIRNGGEDVCPDAFKPIAIYCARMENE